MIIQKKRINKPEKYLRNFNDGDVISLGIKITDDIKEKLISLGFSTELDEGEQILPSRVGSISAFNAEGKSIPLKDQPKEQNSVPIWWSWKDWSGKEYSEVRYRYYERYPRKFISPPSTELRIVENQNYKYVLVNQKITLGETSNDLVKHYINLMLELFGFVEVMDHKLESLTSNVKRLNWEVLPSGNMPWENFKQHLTPVIENATTGKKPVIMDRFETLQGLNPDFRAIGKNGFNGYIIFGFPHENIFIFESAYYGNATYVFEGGWEFISQLTKAEILNNNFQKERIIHQNGWKEKVNNLF